jgi:integrase
MTSKMLLDQYMAERHALGFSSKTDEGCIRRFLRDYVELDDGNVEFTKEYVLGHIGNKLNQQTNTILRDVSAINGFLDFVIRKGFVAYKIPPKSLPKENRNFRAYIFTDDEIARMLIAADHVPFTQQNPARKYQIPVMFRILFNCGLRTSELLKLRMCDVDLKENVFVILDTKFHKNRLVPFSDIVAESLNQYLEMFPPKSKESLIFPSSGPRSNGGRYGNSWLQTQFRQLLRMADIPYNGQGNGPRPHDIRHTFAVHCLNNWALSGEDLTVALPVLSRYLGHNGLTGTQKYLQLTAQMYPDIVAKMEMQFGDLIPQMEAPYENI